MQTQVEHWPWHIEHCGNMEADEEPQEEDEDDDEEGVMGWNYPLGFG